MQLLLTNETQVDFSLREHQKHLTCLTVSGVLLLPAKENLCSFQILNWVSNNSTQFWYHLPDVSIRPHRVKAQSHKTVPTLDTSHVLWPISCKSGILMTASSGLIICEIGFPYVYWFMISPRSSETEELHRVWVRVWSFHSLSRHHPASTSMHSPQILLLRGFSGDSMT